MSLFK